MSRNSRRAYLVALTFVAACRSAPPGAVEAVEPASLVAPAMVWSAAEESQAAPVPDAFWKGFASPTLDALVAEGLAASPTLAIGARRVEAAAASLAAAAGADLPKVQASLSSARSRVNFVGLPIPGSSGVLTSQSTTHALSLGVSWELDLWGRLAAAERGAVANLDATGLDLVAAQKSLAAQIAKAALAIAEARAAQDLAMESTDLAETMLANQERLSKGGNGASEAVLAAEASVAAARATETAAARRSALLSPPLAVLLGRPAGRNASLSEREARALVAELETSELPAAPAAGLPADLLARRPDLAALEARVRQAQAQAEVARAALYPTLSLTGGAGTSGSELKNLLDGDFKVWNLGANLLAPLFQGGALEAAEDRAIADRDVALFAFASQALVAFAEVDSALTGEALLKTQLEELGSWHALLVEAETLLLNKSRRGSAATAQVLAARAARIQADLQLLAVRRELFTNRVDLYLALGGGFEITSEPEPES